MTYSVRSVAATCALGLALLAAAPALAQVQPGRPSRPMAEFSRTLRYQSPTDAVLLMRGLQSPSGTVEVRGKQVLVRDVPAITPRLQEAMDDFDHPRQALRVVVQIVQAGGVAVSPPEGNADVPEPLRSRLRKAFPYSSYRLLSQSGFEANEGTDVSSPIGQDYLLSFRLGTLQKGQMVRLHDFTMARFELPDNPLMQTNLVLSLDRPLAVGMTTDETSAKALLVVLTCTRANPVP